MEFGRRRSHRHLENLGHHLRSHRTQPSVSEGGRDRRSLTQCLPIGPARGIQAGIMPFPNRSDPSRDGYPFSRISHTFASFTRTTQSSPRLWTPRGLGFHRQGWEGDTLSRGHRRLTTGPGSTRLAMSTRPTASRRKIPKPTITISSGLSLRRSEFYTEPGPITSAHCASEHQIMSYSARRNEKDRAHLRRTKKYKSPILIGHPSRRTS